MSLKERLEEVRKKELEIIAEEKNKKEAITLEKKRIYTEKLNEFLKLEKLAKENFIPILNVVNNTYLKNGSISFEPTVETFQVENEEIEFEIKITWDYIDDSAGDYTSTSWKEFSIGTKQDLIFKLYTYHPNDSFFESSLNDENWKDKLEDAIFSLLTSYPNQCYHSFSFLDTSP